MKIDKVSINGKISTPDTGKIESVDAGFTYGLSIFESFRVSGKKVFLFDEHLKRLYSSLDYLMITRPNRDELEKYLSSIIAEFNLEDNLFIRLMISAGPGQLRLSKQSYNEPNIVIYAAKIPKFSATEKSAKILSSITRKVPEYFNITQARLKANGYLSAHLAQSELAQYEAKVKQTAAHGHLEGILLSPKGYVAEALTSNIFWAKEGKLYTPPLSLGILPGIIRNEVVRKQKVQEKLITAEELKKTDEIFLTNSVNYLSPLAKINNIGKPGIAGDIFKNTYKILNSSIKTKSTDTHSFSSY